MTHTGYILRFVLSPPHFGEGLGEGLGEVVAGPFGYANGLALSADGRQLYMVESDSDRILRFEIGNDDRLSEPTVFAENVGRFPDGLALDADGNLYACCYASDEIWRINPNGQKTLIAHDRWGIHLGRPTNLAFGGPNFDEIYVANLGRYTITSAKLGARGQRPANLRM
jgi:sugar lactone lactonase YvrE